MIERRVGLNKITPFLCLTLICLLTVIFTIPASAKTPYRDFQHQPSSFNPGQSFGYYIWHDPGGWHVRTTTPANTHTFHGTIRIDGEFWAVRTFSPDTGDIVLHDLNQNTIQFKFNTSGEADGLDFDVRDASYVQFELYIDGRIAQRNEIALGRYNHHPDGGVFRLSWGDG